MGERLPPQNIEAEAACLGSMLLEGEAAGIALSQLSAGDFYRSAHRLIFEAIRGIHERGHLPDTLLVRDALKAEHKLEEVGGGEYIHVVAASVPSAANVDRYVEIVRQHAQRRGLIATGTLLLRDAEDGMPAEEVRQRHEQRLLKTGPRKGTVVTLQELGKQDPGKRERYTVGLEALDRLTTGLYPGLTIITGPTGAGKTTLGLQIAARVAGKGKQPFFIFSADQTNEELRRIMWSAESRVPIDDLYLQDRTWEPEWPIGFHDGELDMGRILADIRMKAARGTRWFLIDYLGVIPIRGDVPKHEKKEDAAEALKAMSKELVIWVILVAKCPKRREMKQPDLDWIEGGSGVSYAADQVIWVQPAKEGVSEVHVLKNRHGATGKVKLHFEGRIHRFTDAEGQEEEPERYWDK